MGRSVMAEQKANGTTKKLHRVQDDRQVRAAAAALSDLGERCEARGCYQRHAEPGSLGIGIGMGIRSARNTPKVGTPIEIEIRGKRSAAIIVKKPFYRKAGVE